MNIEEEMEVVDDDIQALLLVHMLDAAIDQLRTLTDALSDRRPMPRQVIAKTHNLSRLLSQFRDENF